MILDDERDISRWTADWQVEEPIEPAIRKRILHRSRRHVLAGALSVLTGLVLLAFFTTLAVRRPEPTMIVGALIVWALVILGVGFEFRNRRGTWKPLGETTRDFLDLSHRQVSSRLRGIRFGWALLAIETAFFLPWIAWVVSSDPLRSGWMAYARPYGFLVAAIAIYGIIAGWLSRRARTELAHIDDLRGEL